MLDDRTKALLSEVGEIAARFGHGPVEMPIHYAPILGLFDRCRSTFAAVRLLLAERFAHEAVILGRPLFTESLMLAEIAAADEERRVELVLGWWMKGLADLEGVVLEGQALGDDATDDLAALARRRSQLEGYARRNNSSTRQWRVDEKKLAEAHARRREYLDFDLTHHFVHGTPMAIEQRMTKVTDDTLAVGGPAADVETWGQPAGLFAAASLLHACQAACRIFAWTEPPALNDLMQRVAAAIEAQNLPIQPANEASTDDAAGPEPAPSRD